MGKIIFKEFINYELGCTVSQITSQFLTNFWLVFQGFCIKITLTISWDKEWRAKQYICTFEKKNLTHCVCPSKGIINFHWTCNGIMCRALKLTRSQKNMIAIKFFFGGIITITIRSVWSRRRSQLSKKAILMGHQVFFCWSLFKLQRS